MSGASTQKKKLAEFQREALPHMSALYYFALRMIGNADDAHDLVQDTFVKAWRFFEKFEQGTNCKAWLFRILKNTYINRYRKESREPDTVDFEEVQEFYHSIRSPDSESTDLEQRLFANLLDDEVTAALAALPEDFRTVVILCDLEEFTYEEIADFVDAPIGTVRSRLHRGRKLLQQALLAYARERGFATGFSSDGGSGGPDAGSRTPQELEPPD
jgi:RNA polymerase sigma-70 factor (ECF subfamily)